MTTNIPAVTAALTAHVDPARVLLSHAPEIWNHAVTHQPAVVVRPANADDVRTAVTVATAHGVALSVLGGGHDWAGRSLRDGGLVIDLGDLRSVRVDSDKQVAIVGGGATAADVITAAAQHGLVAATGTVGSVGMTGLTLGGGYGPLTGRHGLALDNLLAADVVLADGTHVHADADSEPDLFWAIRGGGGNFGVITALHIRLHPLETIVTGFMAFPWQQASTVLSGLSELLHNSPEDLTVQSAVLSGPDGQPMMMLAPFWSGPTADGLTWVGKLESLGTLLMSQVAPMPYANLLGMYDAQMVDGNHYAIRTRTVADYTPEVIDALVAAGDTRTSSFSGIPVHHFHGAAARVPTDATAFATRVPHLVVEVVSAWEPNDTDPGQHVAWAEKVGSSLSSASLPGGYVNLLAPDATDQIQGAYGANTARLLDIKRRYDPQGVFTATSLPTL